AKPASTPAARSLRRDHRARAPEVGWNGAVITMAAILEVYTRERGRRKTAARRHWASPRSARSDQQRPPTPAPAARRVVEDAGASGTAALAAAVAGQVPGRDLVPVPTDHARPASVAIGALRCLVVNVAGVYMADAHATGNAPRRRERRRRGRRPAEHLPVGMKGREMERHVRTEILENPGAQPLDFGMRVVLAWDQERRDLEPDLGLVLQVGERIEHSAERAGAELLVEGFGEALEVDVGGIDVAIELSSRR